MTTHILVTGCSSGIGRATALRLAAGGHHVYAGVRKQADGDALQQAAITPLLLDVTSPAQIAAAVRAVAGQVGAAGLAGLVNNAVLVGSIGGRFTPPFVGPLGASKSSLATIGEALRQELAPWNIRVVLIEPGSIHTEAVDKLDSDAEQVMSRATAAGRALYQDAFGRFVAAFAGLHAHGSPPEVVAAAIARALSARRPRTRYLTGRNSRRMALIAAVLPVPAQDTLRRRLTRQPAPGSRVRYGRPAASG